MNRDQLSNELNSLMDLIEVARDRGAASLRAAEARLRGQLVFFGLSDLRPFFDVQEIKYFSREDFIVVVQRCSSVGIFLNAHEVFTPKGDLVDVQIATELSNDWCLALLEQYGSPLGLLFTASYHPPDNKIGFCKSHHGHAV